MRTSLKTILKLVEKKYPETEFLDFPVLMIYTDESGRITRYPTEPYDHEIEFSFGSIEELVEHLRS